jgi:hypothetical protein
VSDIDFIEPGQPARPSIAWSGSSVLLTAAASNGYLCYWWQAAGTTTWHQELVTSPFLGPGWNAAPQLVWTGSDVEIAVAIETGSFPVVASYWQAEGSPTWNAGTSRFGDVTYPSLMYADGQLIWASIEGPSPDTYLRVGDASITDAWSQNEVDGTTELSLADYQAPALAFDGSNPVMAATGADGNLYYWSYLDIPGFGLQEWIRSTVATPQAGISFGAPAMTYANGSPVIADTMSDGVLAVWTLSDNTWVQQDIT